jgi:transposase
VIRIHFDEGYGEENIARIIPISHRTVSRWIAKFVSEKRRKREMKQKKDRIEKPVMPERKGYLKAEIARL